MENKFDVVYEKKIICKISKSTFESRGLSDETLELLKEQYVKKAKTFNVMRNTNDKNILKDCAEEVTLIEFELQKLWGFPQDKNFHEWYYVPKCKCPKLDNLENKGTGYHITQQDCPIHGFD